ncbi:MAG: acyl-CoA dehydrogenase family protein [Rhizomicrobium sp.]
MSESLDLLSATANRLFADLAGRRDEPFDVLWPQIDETGFPALLVPEARGGFGGDWSDAFAVARLSGVHALGLPVADAIIARAVSDQAGFDEADGLVLVAPACKGRLDNRRFTGNLIGVPWGRNASHVIAECDGTIIRLAAGRALDINERANTAGDPRDYLTFDASIADVAATTATAPGTRALGALLRTAQIAGALDAALALSITHVNQRVQFGKPLAKFQAMQQSLAVFAEEAAAVNCAGQAAANAADRAGAELEIACAKLRANMAAGTGGTIAHQAHGAIGFTQECGLHLLTRRLTSWRSEFGGDRYWAEMLGNFAARIGADAVWPELVRRGDTI